MEPSILIPLISALVGSLIGASASIVTIFIQQKQQTKRERLKLACEMALAEQSKQIEIALHQKKEGTIQPIALFQHYHIQLLDALENGKLSPEKVKELREKNDELKKAFGEAGAL